MVLIHAPLFNEPNLKTSLHFIPNNYGYTLCTYDYLLNKYISGIRNSESNIFVTHTRKRCHTATFIFKI